MEASFAIPDSTLIAPNYRIGNFILRRKKTFVRFSENFLKKHKKRHVSKTTRN